MGDPYVELRDAILQIKLKMAVWGCRDEEDEDDEDENEDDEEEDEEDEDEEDDEE